MNRSSSLPLLIAALSSTASLATSAAEHPDFTREVRPILSTYCFKCHGPDEKARKAKLRLDSKESATKEGESGEKAIVPGKPDDSELIRRILSDDSDEVMPPPAAKHELTAEQKDILKRWVKGGAEYVPHWAFVAPKAVTPPEVKKPGSSRNAIDQFVLARLEKEGLAPSMEAEKLALCRRVYLDLTGLPPTLEEADEFARDASADAYEKLVDRLLASPHYGERWARKWLDLARYADTNGYEKDRNRNIWPYRDWVIRAINADMPFDQFTIKQLAGDMLPDATTDDLIATGFHRNTMLNEEGGIDPLEFRYAAMVDRVGTTGTTWMGLTLMCAQCHTHKYDPILHTEYFQLMSFLNNTEEPEMDLRGEDWERTRQKNLAEAGKLVTELPKKWPMQETRWEVAKPVSVRVETPEDSKILDDGSVLFAGQSPERQTYTLTFETTAARVDQLRLEALSDPALPSKGPGRVAHGNFVLSEVQITAQPLHPGEPPVPVAVASATADAEQDGFPVANAFDGKAETGWAVDHRSKKLNSDKVATFRFAKSIGFEGGTRLTVTLVQNYGKQHTIGRPRISFGIPSADDRPVADRRAAAIEDAFNKWLERERARTVNWTVARPDRTKSNSPLLTVEPDGAVFVSGDVTKYDKYELHFANLPPGITAWRLEALADDRLPGHGPGWCYYEGPKGDFLLSDLKLFAGETQVKFASATQSYAKDKMVAANAIDDELQTGWSCQDRLGESHEAAFVLAEPLQSAEATLKLEFSRHYAAPLGRFRISFTTAPKGGEAREIPEQIASLLLVADADLTIPQRQQLIEHFLITAPELAQETKRIRDLRKPPGAQTTLVMHERPPENPRLTFRHNRGEYLQPQEKVEPGVPAFLPPLPPDYPKNRLGFAKWLVSPENPLTARVVVNRYWQAFFGTGLVKTTNDFGFQGEMPSHPELLDWLAVEFMKDGWSVKKLHRLIVTSATYRQASHVTPDLLSRDPQNRLLARGPRVRVEAELVRDIALRASGLLSEKMYGPPVKPPQPAGVVEVAYGSPKWDVSQGEDRYRRAIYTFAKRSAPFAAFNTFDAPVGDVCVARRDVSNTPLQALTLLNDEAFVEAARALGAKAAALGEDDYERAAWIFRRCLTRAPKLEELERLVAFIRQQRTRIDQGEIKPAELAGKDEPETAVWMTLARAVLNLDETITKN